jgi:hypothetical protein
MHDGVDAIRDPPIKFGAIPPPRSEMSMRAFGAAILLEVDVIMAILNSA